MSDDAGPLASLPSFLSVGFPLKLTIQTDQGKMQCGTTLLGWKEKAWLICEWPSQARCEGETPVGAKCLVSYVYKGKLIGYRSEVREIIMTPVPLLFLSFPSSVEEVHLRKHLRVPSQEPVLLLQVDNRSVSDGPRSQDCLGGIVQDLSASGCSVLLPQLPAGLLPGVRILMEFGLPGIGHVTNLSGNVKKLQEQAANYLVGIEFVFNQMEFIEFRGWGGTVQNAIEQCVQQKTLLATHRSECLTE